MVAALQPEMNDPDDEDACNRGFLRDDALLVVTIIQDTYDEDSSGTVDEWIAALRTAKHGDDDAFAVLVLTTDIDVGYQQLCWPNDFSMIKNRLRLLVEGIEHGFIDSICKDEYVSVLRRARGRPRRAVRRLRAAGLTRRSTGDAPGPRRTAWRWSCGTRPSRRSRDGRRPPRRRRPRRRRPGSYQTGVSDVPTTVKT
jgi:hypothetical protein